MARTIAERLDQIENGFIRQIRNSIPFAQQHEMDSHLNAIRDVFRSFRLQIGYDVLSKKVQQLTTYEKRRLQRKFQEMLDYFKYFSTYLNQQTAAINLQQPGSSNAIFQLEQQWWGHYTSYESSMRDLMTELEPPVSSASSLSSEDKTVLFAGAAVVGIDAATNLAGMAAGMNANPGVGSVAPALISGSYANGFITGSLIKSFGGGNSDVPKELALACCYCALLCCLCATVESSDCDPSTKLAIQSLIALTGVAAPIVVGTVVAASKHAAAQSASHVAAHIALSKTANTATTAAQGLSLVTIAKIVSACAYGALLLPNIIKKAVKDVINLCNGRKKMRSATRLASIPIGFVIGFVIGWFVPFGGPHTAILLGVFGSWLGQNITKLYHQWSTAKQSHSIVAPKVAPLYTTEVQQALHHTMQNCSNPTKYQLSEMELNSYEARGIAFQAGVLCSVLETIARAEKIASKKEQNIGWKLADLTYGFYKPTTNRTLALQAIKHLKQNNQVELTSILTKLGIQVNEKLEVTNLAPAIAGKSGIVAANPNIAQDYRPSKTIAAAAA